MKKMIFKIICIVLLGTSFCAIAQNEVKKSEKEAFEVTRYTVMERFEPQLMPSTEQRLKMKEKHVAEIRRRREILDTINISERKRNKLMRDILKNPFSPRLSRTLAEIELEDKND